MYFKDTIKILKSGFQVFLVTKDIDKSIGKRDLLDLRGLTITPLSKTLYSLKLNNYDTTRRSRKKS